MDETPTAGTQVARGLRSVLYYTHSSYGYMYIHIFIYTHIFADRITFIQGCQDNGHFLGS